MSEKIIDKLFAIAGIGVVISGLFLAIVAMIDTYLEYTFLNNENITYFSIPLLFFAVMLAVAIICMEYSIKMNKGNANSSNVS